MIISKGSRKTSSLSRKTAGNMVIEREYLTEIREVQCMKGEWLLALYLSMMMPMVLLTGQTGDMERAGESRPETVRNVTEQDSIME